MNRRKRIAIIAAVCATVYARDAVADDAPPPWHFKKAPTLTSAGGTVLTLPPGYYLADPTFDRLDAELRRAQDAETRLRAENESLRASATEGFGWRGAALVATGALAAGIAIGRLTFH